MFVYHSEPDSSESYSDDCPDYDLIHGVVVKVQSAETDHCRENGQAEGIDHSIEGGQRRGSEDDLEDVQHGEVANELGVVGGHAWVL